MNLEEGSKILCEYLGNKYDIKNNILHYIDADRAGKRRFSNFIYQKEVKKHYSKSQKKTLKYFIKLMLNSAENSIKDKMKEEK